MYAIVETGGKQYRVQPGDTIAVERLTGEPGDTLDLGRVLLVGGGESGTHVGAPEVADAIVRAEVVEHGRGEKIIVFRYKSKVRYRRKTGHRQALTRLRITDILLGGVSAEQPAARAEAAPEPEAAAARPRRRATPATAEATTPESASTEAASTEATATEATATGTASTELPASAAEAGPPPAATPAEPTTDEPTKE
jgi:large subunit ribosomal protein L21